MAQITLPDNSIREIADGSSVYQLAESIGRGLAKAALVGRVDGKLVDLSCPLVGSHAVSIVTEKDAVKLVTWMPLVPVFVTRLVAEPLTEIQEFHEAVDRLR